MSGDVSESKLALVVDGELPVGLIANTAAVLAFTLGSQYPALIGPDLFDGSGERHLGITTVPMPILRAPAGGLQPLRARACELGLLVVDFCDAAQTTTTYGDYTEKLRSTAEPDLRYLGLALYGARKLINKLTGSLPLLR